MFLKMCFGVFFLSTLSMAGVLENIGAPLKSVSASGVAVPIYAQTKLHWKGSPLDGKTLYLTGAGIREKKIVFLNVNVYLAMSYVDKKEPLDLENPMKSLQKCEVKALRMTFLRDVEAEKIRNSFSEALKVNGVDVNSVTMQKSLSQLDFDIKKGTTLTLLGLGIESKPESIIFELPEKILQNEGVGLVDDFWKMWFGISADGGMENLKPELTSMKKLLSG